MTAQSGEFRHRRLTRIAILISAVSFGLYILNVLIGKANIVYGLKMFHLGNVGEFLILLVASVAFIAVALYEEATSKSTMEPEQNEVNT
ncbi:MAG: hypothetical protein V2I36_02075 [Desulfopila sp.]|jgi:hypothetical protein|nr:hypothetical protein [Desulfopila sp.]